MLKRRVVITGLGAMTALGEGAAALWDALLQGRSGVDFVSFGENGARLDEIGAAVRGFTPEKFITQRKALKVMARDIQLAVAAASLALDDAGLKSAAVDRERFGVIVGSGVLNYEIDELAYSVKSSLDAKGNLDLKKFGEEGMPALFPLWLLKYLPNMPACHVSILFDLQGPNNTITTGASAGLQALEEAYRILERGSADLMLAGGAESKLNPVGVSQYKILGVLEENTNGSPNKTYKPFDQKGRGFVIGEGAGFVVLEELEHAKKRNAKIYAEVVGFGCSSQEGRVIALKGALEEAKISPKEIDYVQASGLGLEKDDILEAEAIEEVFNGSKLNLAVSASKPAIGFTGFAAGAFDFIISTLALSRGAIAPTLNLEIPRRDWKFQIVKDKPLMSDIRYAVTNAFGFNGQSVSAVSKRFLE